MKEGNYSVLRIAKKKFQLQIDKGFILPKLPKDWQKAIDQLWEQELAKGRHLFDGELFCFLQMSREKLVGGFFPYRWFLACQLDPVWQTRLPLVAVSVCSITTTPTGRVILGRRSARLASQGGLYEFAASGAIDRSSIMADGSGSIDYRRAILEELHQETALPIEACEATELFALLYDQENPLLELCLSIQVQESALCHLIPNSEEYSELITLPVNLVSPFLENRQGEVVPISQLLWSHWLRSHQQAVSQEELSAWH